MKITVDVSILARLVGRALRMVKLYNHITEYVSILARLVGRALLHRLGFIPVSIKFQSSPGWLAGRCVCLIIYSPDFLSFNPRPAGWPGAAQLMSAVAIFPAVSILARLVGRALRSATSR